MKIAENELEREALEAFNALVEEEPPLPNSFLFDVHFYLPGVIRCPTAAVASKIEPLISEHIDASSHAWIVGNDGTSLSRPDYKWLECVDSWLGKGCHVDYLFVEPKPELKDPVKNLRLKYPTQFRAFRIVESPEDPMVSEYKKEWRTFHFGVFDSPRQLWVETHHPVLSTDAEHCAYFPESALTQTGLWEVFHSRFTHVIENGADPI